RAARRTGGGASFHFAAVLHERHLVGLDMVPLREVALSYHKAEQPGEQDLLVGDYAVKKLMAAHLAKLPEQPAEAAMLEQPAELAKQPKTRSLAVWCELGIDADPFAAANHT